MMKDKIEIIANLTIAVFDAVTGRLLDVIKKHNLY